MFSDAPYRLTVQDSARSCWSTNGGRGPAPGWLKTASAAFSLKSLNDRREVGLDAPCRRAAVAEECVTGGQGKSRGLFLTAHRVPSRGRNLLLSSSADINEQKPFRESSVPVGYFEIDRPADAACEFEHRPTVSTARGPCPKFALAFLTS